MPAIVCAGALFAFFVIFGMRQMREGGGTLTRLLLVSAGLAVLAAAPILLWETSSGAPANLMLAVPALVASMPLLRPLRRPGSSVALPLIDDPPLLARVESVARRLGVAMPRVRLIGTVGEMQALAGVGGIQAPSLLLADGILHRLSPAEQDGIIAHELAHIRNGSLWALPAAAAVATTLAIVLMDSNVAAWLVSFAAFSLFPAVYAVANRYIELDCDLRAARAVGFVEMATALDKIHAVHLLGGRGWLTHLFYAVATHPAGPVRYEWLRARSAGALPPRPQDEPARRLHRICSSVAFAALVAALTAGRLFQGRAPTVAFALLMAPLACVLLLCVLLMRRIQAANKERFRQRPPGKRLALAGAGSLGLGFALGLGAKPLAVALLTAGASRAGIWVWNVMPLVAVAALLCGTAVLFWGALRFNRWQKLQLAMTAALARHDYRNAIGLLRARPGMLKRDPSLRYALAVALFLAGEREAALADLVRLVEERLPAALLLLAHLARGSDPARALASPARPWRNCRAIRSPGCRSCAR